MGPSAAGGAISFVLAFASTAGSSQRAARRSFKASGIVSHGGPRRSEEDHGGRRRTEIRKGAVRRGRGDLVRTRARLDRRVVAASRAAVLRRWPRWGGRAGARRSEFGRRPLFMRHALRGPPLTSVNLRGKFRIGPHHRTRQRRSELRGGPSTVAALGWPRWSAAVRIRKAAPFHASCPPWASSDLRGKPFIVVESRIPPHRDRPQHQPPGPSPGSVPFIISSFFHWRTRWRTMRPSTTKITSSAIFVA